MAYTLELGNVESVTHYATGLAKLTGFEVVFVQPFGGSAYPSDPEFGKLSQTSAAALYMYGDETPPAEPASFPNVQLVNDDGLVAASIDVSHNFTARIDSITGIHFSSLQGASAAETAPHFIRLMSELNDDTKLHDSWLPTGGNIKRLASTLLDWAFEYPDAVFRAAG